MGFTATFGYWTPVHAMSGDMKLPPEVLDTTPHRMQACCLQPESASSFLPRGLQRELHASAEMQVAERCLTWKCARVTCASVALAYMRIQCHSFRHGVPITIAGGGCASVCVYACALAPLIPGGRPHTTTIEVMHSHTAKATAI